MVAARNARLLLSVQTPRLHRTHASYIQRHLRAAHRLLNPPLNELSLALVGDKKMSDLHRQFLGIAGPTDVLTFPLDIDRRGRPISGEVVICVPEARRRCRETGGNLREELLLYALHGLLHLCGYDDRTDRDFKKMHAREDQILSQIGVGPVFFQPFSGGPKGRVAKVKPRSTTGQREITARKITTRKITAREITTRESRIPPRPTRPSGPPLKGLTTRNKHRGGN